MKRLHKSSAYQASRSYSPVVVTEGGRTVWVSGQTGLVDEQGQSMAGNFEGQARVIFRAIDAVVKRAGGEKVETVNTVYPNVYDGVEGMLFITKCVESSKQNGGWVAFRHPKSRK